MTPVISVLDARAHVDARELVHRRSMQPRVAHFTRFTELKQGCLTGPQQLYTCSRMKHLEMNTDLNQSSLATARMLAFPHIRRRAETRFTQVQGSYFPGSGLSTHSQSVKAKTGFFEVGGSYIFSCFVNSSSL